jgi:hypothetical protein
MNLLTMIHFGLSLVELTIPIQLLILMVVCPVMFTLSIIEMSLNHGILTSMMTVGLAGTMLRIRLREEEPGKTSA